MQLPPSLNVTVSCIGNIKFVQDGAYVVSGTTLGHKTILYITISYNIYGFVYFQQTFRRRVSGKAEYL